MRKLMTMEKAPFPKLVFDGKVFWEGEDELPSWAGFRPRKSRAPLGETGDGRVKVRVIPPKSRAPVITGRLLLAVFAIVLGLKVAGLYVAKLAGPMSKVSWWIVGVPLVCYFLVRVMRMIGAHRAAKPTSEQEGAYEFLKQNEQAIGKAVLKAVFDEYPRLRKGFGKDEWEEMGARVMQVNQMEEMKVMIGIESARVMNLEKDGRAYLGFEFNCNWDQKGFDVVTHGFRVVEIGPANGEFDAEAAQRDGGERVGRYSEAA
jgi:hypothetical protein